MPVLLKKKTLFFFFGALLALQNPKGFVLTKIFDFCIATKIFDFCNGACKPKVFEKRMRSEFPAGFEPFHIFDNVKNVRYIFSFVKYVNFCFWRKKLYKKKRLFWIKSGFLSRSLRFAYGDKCVEGVEKKFYFQYSKSKNILFRVFLLTWRDSVKCFSILLKSSHKKKEKWKYVHQ